MEGSQDLSISIKQNQIILIDESGGRRDVSGSFLFSDRPTEIEKGRFNTEFFPELEVFNTLLDQEAD